MRAAVAGEEIGQQYAHWLVSDFRGDVRVKFIYVQCGINDILHGSYTASQIIANMTTMINDMQTMNPWSTIRLEKMDPAKTKLDAVSLTGGPNRYQQWLDVNAGLAAAFPTIWHTDISDNLNDGADSLKATRDSGDGLHPNSTGDTESATILNTWASSLPGGWNP